MSLFFARARFFRLASVMWFKILTMTEAAKTKRIEDPECSIVDLKMTFFLNEKQSRKIVNMFTICWCQTRCRFLSRCFIGRSQDCHVNKKITFKCAISRCTIRWFYVRTCFFSRYPRWLKIKYGNSHQSNVAVHLLILCLDLLRSMFDFYASIIWAAPNQWGKMCTRCAYEKLLFQLENYSPNQSNVLVNS